MSNSIELFLSVVTNISTQLTHKSIQTILTEGDSCKISFIDSSSLTIHSIGIESIAATSILGKIDLLVLELKDTAYIADQIKLLNLFTVNQVIILVSGAISPQQLQEVSLCSAFAGGVLQMQHQQAPNVISSTMIGLETRDDQLKQPLQLKPSVSHEYILLIKPFYLHDLLELMCKKIEDKKHFYCINNQWVYDEAKSYIYSYDKKIILTNKENKLFKTLLMHSNAQVKKEYLRQQVWAYHHNTESTTVETHLYKLKQKIPELALQIKNSYCQLSINSLQ